LRGKGHNVTGWGVGGSVCGWYCGSKVCLFEQWVGTNCAALPAASAGQWSV